MMRIVATTVVALIGNAIALVVADQVLDDLSLTLSGFLIAVALFTAVVVLASPLIRQVAVTKAPALIGSTALIATLVSLVVTVLVSDGLAISGLTTWVLATVIVWVIALAARMLLPLVIFKRALGRREGQPA